MSSILQLLKLADFPAPQQQPSQAAPPPPQEAAKPPPPVEGSAFKAPTITPTAGSGGFTVQHEGLGNGAISTEQAEAQQQVAEQQQQLDEQKQHLEQEKNKMIQQQVGDMQTQVAMTVDQNKQTQDLLKNNTNQWLKSMSSRLSGASKAASDPAYHGGLKPDSPTGHVVQSTPPVPLGAVGPNNPLSGLYNLVRPIALSGLWNRYAPKPLGAIKDINTRFGNDYINAAQTIGQISQKQPPGIALLANMAGGLVSKYMNKGPDLSNAGTDVSNFVDKVGPVLNQTR